jgi:hemerythrin-like domain-containing protein
MVGVVMPIQIGAPPESTFADPVRLLSECHRRVEMFLAVLVKCGEGAQPGAPPPPELANALRYFREAAPKHTADEEESLFPRLAGRPEAAEAMRGLEADHADAAPRHALVDRIGETWIAEGSISPETLREFRAAVAELATMYRRHIEIEDQELFPLAQRVLSPQEKHQVGREMASRRHLGA